MVTYKISEVCIEREISVFLLLVPEGDSVLSFNFDLIKTNLSQAWQSLEARIQKPNLFVLELSIQEFFLSHSKC
jgi:hypothetical protein